MKQYTSREYYTIGFYGHKEFLEGRTTPRHRKALNLLDPKPGQLILDVGCGRGEIIRECGMKSQVVGTDFSDASIQFARRHGRPLVRGSSTHLPFRREVFDSVTFLEVMEHLTYQDVEKSFNEIHRILKPGGRVVAQTTTHPLGEFPLDKMVKAYLRRSRTLGSFYTEWKKPRKVANLARPIFKRLRVEEDPGANARTTLKDMVMRGVIPYRLLWLVGLKEGEVEPIEDIGARSDTRGRFASHVYGGQLVEDPAV